MVYNLEKIVQYLFLSCALGTCASTLRAQSGFVSQSYHDVTARYNSLFLVREHMKTIQEHLRSTEQLTYDEILPISSPYDTAILFDVSDQVKDIIKKSSQILQYHSSTKYSDEAYYFLGISRHYHGEKEEAIRTLKYLASRGKEDVWRQAAHIQLCIYYMQDTLLEEAKQAARELELHLPFDQKNMLAYTLMRAQLAQYAEDFEGLIKYIKEALSLAKQKHQHVRLQFILGQTYERLRQSKQAAKYYTQCTKRLISYRFYLEAKLRAQVQKPIRTSREVEKRFRIFKKELKQLKNIDLHHIIYFHLAHFYLTQDNQDAAITAYLASVRNNTNDRLLKGRAYEQLARFYYGQGKHIHAASYYDSAAQALPKHARGYNTLHKKAEIMTRWAAHARSVIRADSLLHLAALPKDSLERLLQARLVQISSERKRKRKQLRAQTVASLGLQRPNTRRGSQGTWYFYNSKQVSDGKNFFVRQWGNRPLQDNWRTEKQGASAQNIEENVTHATSKRKKSEQQELQTLLKQWRANIPRTEEKQRVLYKNIENGYLGMGNIYYLELEEYQLGIEKFQELIRRFSQSIYKARIFYILAQDSLVNESLRNTYAEALRKDFADSIYTKLLDNPNYLIEQAAAQRALSSAYEKAYRAYESKQYHHAQTILKTALKGQSNTFTDNALLLDLLIDGQLGKRYLYQYKLQHFLHHFNDSELYEYATTLLSSAKKVQIETIYSSKPQYTKDLNSTHHLIWYCKKKYVADTLRNLLNYHPIWQGAGRAEILFLDTNQWLVYLPAFDHVLSAQSAYTHYATSSIKQKIQVLFPLYSPESFLIHEKNLRLLFTSKDIDTYKVFFLDSYAYK